jgi:hypothetical protein
LCRANSAAGAWTVGVGRQICQIEKGMPGAQQRTGGENRANAL